MTKKQRLFVALAVPQQTSQQLLLLQPKSLTNVRTPVNLTPINQLHITLSFIGMGYKDPIIESLLSLQSVRFPLTIRGLGKFNQTNGRVVYWAGIESDPRLLQLHKNIKAALNKVEFPASDGDFTPHITLLRTKSDREEEIDRMFLRQHFSPLVIPDVVGFGLYSSTVSDNTSHYSLEYSFPLACSE